MSTTLQQFQAQRVREEDKKFRQLVREARACWKRSSRPSIVLRQMQKVNRQLTDYIEAKP